MTWATPALGLIAAACIIPPLILLYFLKLRRREQVIPSTLLWQQAVQDMQANAPFQRLRMNLLLFLQLLALLLIFAALAQPEIEAGAGRAPRTILLIDRSASMSATDLAPTRLDAAKREAIEFVEGMRIGGAFSPMREADKAMVVGFADEAQVYSGFTGSKAELIQAIEAITPTHGGTSIKQALELARAYATNPDPEGAPVAGPTATVLLFSDGKIRDLSEVVAKEPVTFYRVGDPEQDFNVGIAAVGARRSPADLSEIVVYARVVNHSSQAVTVSVLLSVGDQLLKTTSTTIPPAAVVAAPGADEDTGETADGAAPGGTGVRRPGAAEVVFRLLQTRGMTLGVEVDVDDLLDVDDRAFVVVPAAKELRVGLVNPNWVITAALQGMPFVERIEQMSVDRYNQLVAEGTTDQFDVIVLNDVEVPRVGPGRYLTLGQVPPIEGLVVEGEPRPNVPLAWDTNHPVNRVVSYDRLYVSKWHPLQRPEDDAIIVEGSEGPLVVEASRPGLHAIVVPFNTVLNGWFQDTRHVIFLQNVLDYLGHLGQALTEESLRPGEALTARLPRAARDIVLTLPNGEKRTLTPADPSMTSYGPLEMAGLYRLEYRMPEVEEPIASDYAVNLLDESEGDIVPAATVKFSADEIQTIAGDDALQKRPLWPWAVAAALLVMMVEWWVYNRRSYI